ncbi:hypothetical protein MnTg02_01719 [bacterium MnTg02]|nr:hypothetical protein MnTg02_01719 [bacterium MnTg02]
MIRDPRDPFAPEISIIRAAHERGILAWNGRLITITVQRPSLHLAFVQRARVQQFMKRMQRVIALSSDSAEVSFKFFRTQEFRHDLISNSSRTLRKPALKTLFRWSSHRTYELGVADRQICQLSAPVVSVETTQRIRRQPSVFRPSRRLNQTRIKFNKKECALEFVVELCRQIAGDFQACVGLLNARFMPYFFRVHGYLRLYLNSIAIILKNVKNNVADNRPNR